MKHIGWCLERIEKIVNEMPKKIDSEENKTKATNLFDEIQECLDTLAALILNPKFKEDLHKLETSPIEGVRLQAHEVEELFKDLEHMLYTIDLYIKTLRTTMDDPKKWQRNAYDLVENIHQKFGVEKGELRKEFQIALHTEEELRRLGIIEKHLEEFLK